MNNKESSTALLTAAQGGHYNMLKHLLEAIGADSNELDREGRTALMIAVTGEYVKCAQLLLKHGADPNLPCKNGRTPLFIAAKKGSLEIVKVLLHSHAGRTVSGSADIDVSISNSPGMPMVADVNAKDKNNCTALMMAAANGHTALVVYLIEKGANVSDTNKSGRTALDMAVNAGASEIVSILNSAAQSAHLETLQVGMAGEPADVLSATGEAVTMVVRAGAALEDSPVVETEGDASEVEGHRHKRRKTRDVRTPDPPVAIAESSSWPIPVSLPATATATATATQLEPAPTPTPEPSVPPRGETRKRPHSEVSRVDANLSRAREVNVEYTAARLDTQIAYDRLCTAAVQGKPLAIEHEFFTWLSQPGFRYNPNVRFALAVLQYHGVAMVQDTASAVATLLQLANQHHANAQCVLAQYYADTANGRLYPEEQSLRWYTAAAAQDHPEALFRLAVRVLAVPDCSPAEQALATEYLYRAAVRGHSAAVLVYPAVLRGHPAALQGLGDCYRHGTGVPCDESQAIAYYRQSAEKNDADGAFCLGECYKFAIGTDPDVVEEAKNFKKAADLGHAEACLYTGMHYFNGTGDLAQSDVVAWQYLRYASLHGHDEGTIAQAEYMMGRLTWHRGNAVLDSDRAVKLVLESCNKGHVLAHIELAIYLTFTVNTDASKAEAELLLSIALAMPLMDDISSAGILCADRTSADIYSLDVPFAVLFPLPVEPHNGLQEVHLRVLASSEDGTYMTEDDEESADGDVKSGRFVADAQWIEDAAPLLKVGLLHLALFPAIDATHTFDELLGSLQLLQSPWQRPAIVPNAHHPAHPIYRPACVFDSVKAIDNAVYALHDIDRSTKISENETAQHRESRRLRQENSLCVVLDFSE